jgi:DNA repair protein RadC
MEQGVIDFEAVRPFRFRVSLVREEGREYVSSPCLGRPRQVALYLWREVFHDLDREAMAAVYLDVRNRLIGCTVAYVGTLNRSVVEPRGLIVPGLLANAAGFVVAHNHPSGDPTPSPEDLMFTRKLAQACEVVGIRLLDHLILADARSWISLRQSGAW